MLVFGYLRVSKEREGMISPDVQRAEILRYCERKGWTVAEWFEDLDWSATKYRPLEMPGFARMVERAEAGEAGALVFYRVDRAVREHTGDFIILRSRLKRAGVQIAFAGRDYDDTPEGQFALDLDAILARLESQRLGARIKDAHRRLAETGRWHGGRPPFGFQPHPERPGLVSDPEEARSVRKVHELYQRGWSIRAIALHLNEQGVSPRAGRWESIKIRNVLMSAYQVGGRLVDGHLVLGDNVEAIVPLEVWERTQALRAARGQKKTGGRTPSNGLRGKILRCGTCGGPLEVHYRKGGTMLYRCAGPGNKTCTRGVAMSAHLLEPIVQRRLIVWLRSSRAPQSPKSELPDLRPTRDAIDAVAGALVRLATAYAEGDMTKEEYQGARSKLIAKQTRLEAQLARETRKVETRTAQALTAELREDLRKLTVPMIAAMPARTRRELYEMVIERIDLYPDGHYPRLQVRFRQ